MCSKRKYTIIECCDILNNLRIPINDEIRQTMQGNIPYYGANGVQGYIDKYIFDEDLILLAEDGGNFEEYHTKPIAYKISGKSWVNNHAHILRAKQDFNQNYIFYSLVHKNITKYLNSGTRSKLNRSELEKIEIDFPETKGEEDKIADILSTCDTAIEKTQAAIAKYKVIKQGMLHDLFTRGIDIQSGKFRPRYQEAPELYKESKLGWIPKEWEVLNLEKIGDFKNGINKEKTAFGHGTLFVNIGDAYFETLDCSVLNRVATNTQEIQDYQLVHGDIIFVRSSVKPSGVGYNTVFYECGEPVVFCGFMIRYRLMTKTNFYLLFITHILDLKILEVDLLEFQL